MSRAKAFLFPISGGAVRPRRGRGDGRRRSLVATPAGSLPELVEHGVTGFLGRTERELTAFVREVGRIDRAGLPSAAPQSDTVSSAWFRTTRRSIGS